MTVLPLLVTLFTGPNSQRTDIVVVSLLSSEAS